MNVQFTGVSESYASVAQMIQRLAAKCKLCAAEPKYVRKKFNAFAGLLRDQVENK
jgi:hypothetical protein